MKYEVKEVQRKQCEDFILNIHYAKRWPSISYAFGLFEGSVLVGVVTYGSPPSPTLTKGIDGEEFKQDVLELNRLCLKNNKPNEASLLVGRSLKLLPKNRIVVSFADTSQEHIGYVYQATNFIYCGLSAKRTDYKVRGLEHLHTKALTNKVQHIEGSKIEALRAMFGDDLSLVQRPRKHRYIFICGTKYYKNKVLRNLRYRIEPYPKKNKEEI